MVRPYNFNISPIPLSEKLYLERVWSFQSGGNSTPVAQQRARLPITPVVHSLR